MVLEGALLSTFPSPQNRRIRLPPHLGFEFIRKTREGWNCRFQKSTPHGRWGQGPGSVDQRFPAGLPFPVPEILEFVAFGASRKIFPAIFPGLSRSFPREPPNRPRKQPQPSRVSEFMCHKLWVFSSQKSPHEKTFASKKNETSPAISEIPPVQLGTSMTGSERPSPEPLLKKEASPAVPKGPKIEKNSISIEIFNLA